MVREHVVSACQLAVLEATDLLAVLADIVLSYIGVLKTVEVKVPARALEPLCHSAVGHDWRFHRTT